MEFQALNPSAINHKQAYLWIILLLNFPKTHHKKVGSTANFRVKIFCWKPEAGNQKFNRKLHLSLNWDLLTNCICINVIFQKY